MELELQTYFCPYVLLPYIEKTVGTRELMTLTTLSKDWYICVNEYIDQCLHDLLDGVYCKGEIHVGKHKFSIDKTFFTPSSLLGFLKLFHGCKSSILRPILNGDFLVIRSSELTRVYCNTIFLLSHIYDNASKLESVPNSLTKVLILYTICMITVRESNVLEVPNIIEFLCKSIEITQYIIWKNKNCIPMVLKHAFEQLCTKLVVRICDSISLRSNVR